MALLTEEEIGKREDIFFELVEHIVQEHYPDIVLEPITEEDAYLFSIALDHFVENYRNPTLYESYVAASQGQEEPDFNDALYEELVDLLLDESIGSKIATVAHGIRHFLAGKKQERATKRTAATAQKLATAKKKASAHAWSAGNKPKSSGVMGTMQSQWHKERAGALKARTAAAKTAHAEAEKRAKEATAKHQEAGAKRAGLAKKIDTGISNIKKKVTGAIHQGAARVAGAASRVASKFY